MCAKCGERIELGNLRIARAADHRARAHFIHAACWDFASSAGADVEFDQSVPEETRIQFGALLRQSDGPLQFGTQPRREGVQLSNARAQC
eukprot:2132265-Alexandrium_andersonii.AAC.1